MGYLPGTPFYLISDAEMFEAFLKDEGVFADYYPCPDEKFQECYDALLKFITDSILDHLANGTELPKWIYSYMMLRPITYSSPEADIAYLCELANVKNSNIVAEFSPEVAAICYEVSKKWIQKNPARYDNRPPTMFGETHVTKSLRLDQANVLYEPTVIGDD